MNVEELKGMTHEDLVRCVQELEEENKKLKSENDGLLKSWSEQLSKYNAFKDAIKGIAMIA